MFSGVKKAAAVLQSTARGHSELSMVIFNEKCHSEAIEKLISTKNDANASVKEWCNQESNVVLTEFVNLMTETDQLWAQLMYNYLGEYDAYRKSFKAILQGEKALDEKKRDVEVNSAKVAKLKKQLASMGKKTGDLSRVEALDVELAKAISLQEASEEERASYASSHERYKFVKVQEAMQVLSKSSKDLHAKCQTLIEAQSVILNICLQNSQQPYTEEAARIVYQDGRAVITRVSEVLDLARPRQTSELEAGATFQSHVAKRALSTHLSREDEARMSDRKSMPLPPLPSNTEKEKKATVTKMNGSGRVSARPSMPLPPRPSMEDNMYIDHFQSTEESTYSDEAVYDNNTQNTMDDNEYVAMTAEPPVMEYPDESYMKMKRLSQQMPIGNTAHLWGKRTSFQDNLSKAAMDELQASHAASTSDQPTPPLSVPATEQSATETSEMAQSPEQDAYDDEEIVT